MRPKETNDSKLHNRKQKKNERNRKIKQGTRSNDEHPSHQDAKVPQERGTRIGGSTSHLLSEPGTGKVQGIETFHTPPPLEEAMTPQMERYKAMLQRLMPTPYQEDAGQPQQLNIKMKPNQVYAVIAEDDSRYYRTVMIKQNDFTNGFSLNVSNPVMGIVPDGMQVVAQHAVFKQMREMNAFESLEAFPYRGRDGR